MIKVEEDDSIESEQSEEEMRDLLELLGDTYHSKVKGEFVSALKQAGQKFRRGIITRTENAR